MGRLRHRAQGLQLRRCPLPRGARRPFHQHRLGLWPPSSRPLRPRTQAGLAFIKFLSTPGEGAYIASQDYGEPDSPAQVSQPALKAIAAKAPGYNVFTNIVHSGGVRPISPEWGAISADLYTEISDALRR